MVWRLFQNAREAASGIDDLLTAAHHIASTVPVPGPHQSRKSGSGEQFWQFRDYLPDDPRRAIDWRKSARSDKTIIRQREDERPQTLSLWADPGNGMEITYNKNRPTKAVCAQTLLLALGILALRQHDHVRSHTAQSQTVRSESGLLMLAQNFADHMCDPLADLKNTQQSARDILILAGDFLDPLETCADDIKALHSPQRKLCILQCLDPDEINFPFTGRTIFDGPEKNASEKIDHAQDIAETYKTRIKDHLNNLSDFCATQNILYVRHICGDPLERSLQNIVRLLNDAEAV